MTNHNWDLKLNYMLAFAVDKHGTEFDHWTLIAKDLSDFIQTTAENCQTQFEHLCQQYGQDRISSPEETLHAHIFSIVKRLYYSDLCERMNESRNLLMVMYDFIRLYKGGRLTIDDVNEILQDLRSSTSNFNDGPDHERQEKIKLFQRLKTLLAEKVPDSIEEQEIYSSPMEVLAPPPMFSPSTSTSMSTVSKHNHPGVSRELNAQYSDNDKSMTNGHHETGAFTSHSSTQEIPVISSTSNMQPINGEDNEIELSSDDDQDVDEDEDDDDCDDNDRTVKDVFDSSINKSRTDSNQIDDHDGSNDDVSNEEMETNELSNVQVLTAGASTSDDRDMDDHISSVSISNQSTVDTGLSTNDQGTSNINGDIPAPSSIQANASVSSSSDHVTLDSDPVPLTLQEPSGQETESTVEATSRIDPIEDDEAARMDAEQTPEHVPVHIDDVPVPSDDAVFVVDELITGNHQSDENVAQKAEPTTSASHEGEVLTEIHDNEESPTKRRRSNNHPSRSSLSHNFRKSVNAILMNLKNAKYGPDFSKSLKSFKLQDDYYTRIKKPVDIPEIRQKMTNGDYDSNILLFERDVLLMLTNALCNYHRDDDIHGHAREMMDYALELFTPLEETYTPWQTINVFETNDNHRSPSNNNGHDYDDHESRTRTLSVASTSSSIRTNSSTQHHRSQTTSTHTMQKRQRKTFHSF